MNDVIRSLKERRSVRAYREEQVREEELRQILEAATYAPSGMGKQSAVMVVGQGDHRQALQTQRRRHGG